MKVVVSFMSLERIDETIKSYGLFFIMLIALKVGRRG